MRSLKRRLFVMGCSALIGYGQASADDLSEVVKILGWLNRPEVLALQRAADSLLVVTEGPSRRSVATGKVFEYLNAKRPILVLGEGTEAARIVLEAGAGIATSATDPTQIEAALRSLLTDAPSVDGSDRALERYTYPRLVARLAEVIEEVV